MTAEPTDAVRLQRLGRKIARRRDDLAALERERDDLIRSADMRPTDIAASSGLSKGRVTQIRMTTRPPTDPE